MQAAWYDRNGPAKDVLTVGDWPTPTAGTGEVLVRVHSSGVNPSDVKSRAGRPLIAPAIIAHSDGAGVIEAVGDGIAASRIGERVWLWNGQWQRPMGTCATHIALPSAQAVTLPAELSFEEGACLGIPALTAYEAMRWAKQLVGPLANRTVLVIGSANSVGAYAVQMAKQEGATVIGTVGSEAKALLAKSLGADHLIHYKTADVAEQVKTLTGGKGVDVIIDMDLSSMDTLVCGGALATHGTVVCYGSNSMNHVNLTFRTWLYLSVTLKLFLVYDLTPAEREAALAGLTQQLSERQLKHIIGQRFELSQVAQAHEAVEQGLSVGNVVINLPV
jgi:NADPH:quinone reductase